MMFSLRSIHYPQWEIRPDFSVIHIGRDSSNDVIPRSSYVSERHAMIQIQNGVPVLFDLNTKYGTFVNGRRVQSCALNPGDVISFGNDQWRVEQIGGLRPSGLVRQGRLRAQVSELKKRQMYVFLGMSAVALVILMALITGVGGQTTSSSIAPVIIAQTTATQPAIQISSPQPGLNTPLTPTLALTPSVTPTPTVPPTETPTATPTQSAVVSGSVIDVREGPGTEYLKQGRLNKNEELDIIGQFKDCAWLKVSSRNQSMIGWIPGDKGYVELRITCENIPLGTFRPLTGVIKPNQRGGGYGELTVDNGTTEDGVVILTLSDDPVMAAYIRSGDSFTMKGIRNGTYYLYFSKGAEWNGKAFTTTPSHQKFEDAFEFTSGGRWSVTLHGVVGGTASAEEVDESEFPDIGD